MNSELRWALIFGGVAALANFAVGIITSLCGFLFSPIAAGLAAYFSLKKNPTTPNAIRFGAQIGLVAGGVGSIGIVLSAAAAGILWGILPLVMMLAAIYTSSNYSDMWAVVLSSGAGFLFVVALALVVSLFSIGLCVAVGAIVGKTTTSYYSASKSALDK